MKCKYLDLTWTKDAYNKIINPVGSRIRVRLDGIARVGCDMKPVSTASL